MKKNYTKLISLLFISIIYFNVYSAQGDNVYINEFMSVNKTIITDEDGDYSDWIEIYNPTDSKVQLEGWALTDDANELSKWIFPDMSIASKEYIIVFASGKNRNNSDGQLHTNFKLSGAGEYLALITAEGVLTTDFNPVFPEQLADVSYGLLSGDWLNLLNPSPGGTNESSSATLPIPNFNFKHGFYDAPFALEISSSVIGASIYYTLNGNTPTAASLQYSSSILISSTTIVRAIAKSDSHISESVTQTYLFLDDVIQQPNNPIGYPTEWGPYTGITGNAIADYEMDSEMLSNAAFADSVKAGLLALPVVSLVSDIGDFFSHSKDPNTGGIYIYTGAPITDLTYDIGRGWERPVSFEYFNSDGSINLQANAGIRLHGGHGRRAEKTPKHSFRLVFKSEYGSSKLNYPLYGENAAGKYNNITLLAGFCNSWTHWYYKDRELSNNLRDIWTKDVQLKMEHPAFHTNFAHLYINGIYWGLYKMSEKPDKDFAESYLGGDKENFDVIKDYAEVSDGNITAWNKLMSLSNSGLKDTEDYMYIQGKNTDGTNNPDIESYVDIDNLIDYMLINFYGGNVDWDDHNWAAIRNRVEPGKGFMFFNWDAEHTLKTISENVTNENNSNCPSRVFHQLTKNDEFKRLFANHVQKHCYGNGWLAPKSASKVFTDRGEEIEKAINAESARWGDYRRDVHPFLTAGPFALYTKEDHWLPQIDFMTNTYFPQRTDILLNQLRAEGLYPDVDAPIFLINSNPNFQNPVSVGDKLSMSANEGTIYYTTDGTDPVLWGDLDKSKVNNKSLYSEISQSAKLYIGPINLELSTNIKARTFINGEWSAQSEMLFVILKDYYDLKVTEIHYNPLGKDSISGSLFEFIELKNTGDATINMNGIQITKGINYTFTSDIALNPNEFIVLASNKIYFNNRYNFYPFDEYKGQLNNSGENIVILSPLNDTIASFAYNNSAEWPKEPDGSGYSLVPVDYNPDNNQNAPELWRASYEIGGSPRRDDTPVSVIEELSSKFSKNGQNILSDNYPNPFSESTYINYQIDYETVVDLSVYNMMGQLIINLASGIHNPGLYQVKWDGTDRSNANLKNGIYFYRLTLKNTTENSIITKKMILLK